MGSLRSLEVGYLGSGGQIGQKFREDYSFSKIHVIINLKGFDLGPWRILGIFFEDRLPQSLLGVAEAKAAE